MATDGNSLHLEKPLLRKEKASILSCIICGAVGQLEKPSESLLSLLIKADFVSSDVAPSETSICSQCSPSASLLERAGNVCSVVRDSLQKRHLNGGNGVVNTALTALLLKHGNDVNMPGDVETRWKIPDNDDGLQLVIEDVRSGVDLLEVNNESSHSATNLPIIGDRLVVDGSEIQNPNPQRLPTEDAASTSLSSNPASPKVPPPLENTSTSTSLSSNPASPKVPPSLENTCNSLARHLTSSASERSCESGLTESSIASSNNGRGKPGWKCSQCTMAFVSSSLLVSHVHSTHSDMKAGEMMTCPFCTKNFPTFTQLDDHITKLHGDGSHSCQGCYSVFLRASLLRNHQRSCSAYRKHLQEKKQVSKTGRDTGSKNVCTHCLLSLPDEDALSHHIQQCRTECLSKKYNCEGCLAGYDVLISLFTHQADCTLFSKISSLSSDYSVTLRCQGCNAAHSDLAAFSNHKNECNKVQDLRDRELNEKIQVKQTEKCLQPLRNSEDEPVGQSPATNTCYQCLECDRSFANQDLLNKHRQNMHNIVDSCAFKCSGCNVGFSTESALDVHYQLCRQSEPIENLYECPECLTKLEFKSLLEFHKSIHVDPEAKPFKCFGCNGGFTAATHKASHEQKCGKCKLLRQDRARVSTLDKSTFKSSENKGITQTSPSTLPHAQRCRSKFQCNQCSNEFVYFCDLDKHSCIQKETAKDGSESCHSLTDSNCETDMDDTIITEFLRTVDYLALEILCPICGIELKYQQDLSRSALKKHVTRHLVGHGKQVIKRVSCPGCHWGSSYPSRPHYLRHTNHCRVIKEKFPSVELNKQVVRCPICLVRFSSVPQCATHCAEHHINSTNHSEKIYICEGCSAWYNSEMALHEHQSECFLYPRALSAAGIGVACGVCSIRFAKREKCEAHISQFHKISSNSFICVFCNMVLETLDGLIEHVNTICPLAQSISRTGHEDMCIDKKLNKAKVAMQKQVDAKSNYIDDENTNKARTNQKSKLKPLRRGWVQCKICFAKSKASDSEQHALIHSQKELRPYRCKVCDGGFNTTGNLHNHQFYCQRRKSIVEDLPDLPASPEVVSVSPSQSPNSIVDASQCNNELTLPRHEENSSFALPTMLCDAETIPSPVHTQSPIDVPANLEIGVVQGENSFILTCDFCKKTFDTTELMAEHLVNFHGTAGLVCSICLKSFTFEETLTEHLLHCNDDSSGSVVNTCKEANTTENQGQGNDEVEEWKCLSCCIKFTKETNFLLHIASHEVTNVGKCNLCAASFKSAADICMHMVKYHRNFLMNGTKEGGSQDDSDKDSDDDSDVELQSVTSKASLAQTKPTSTVPEKSPKSAPLNKVVAGSSISSAVTNDKRSAPSKQNEYARATVADFKYHCLVGTKCLVCNRNFASKAILKRHYGIHDGYYNAVCPICGIGFCKRTMLRKHKVRVHRTAKATDSTCSRCGGAFEQEYRLKKHMEVCICPKNDSVVQCLQCVRTFDTWHQLKGHLWTHINKCTYCDEKISVQSKRVDHMLSCVKNPLITGECLPTSVKTVVSPPQKPLQSKAAPKSTKKIPEKNFKCKECCSEYTTMKALKKHEVVHEQAEYRCRVCGGKFSSLLAKNRHILREHESKTRIIKAAPKEEPKVEPTETVAEEPRQETFYMCTLCNRVFKDTETKLQHMRDAHGMDAPNNRKLIDCRHCGKRFPTKFARRRHLQTAHSGSNSQPQSLVCHFCTKRFPSNFAKLQHMKKIHKLTESELAPRKQKVCKVCGETFEGKSELKAHKRSVHSQLIMNNSIDLAPDMLLLGDASSSDLVFSPPKVRVCRHCDMTFVHKSELKAHCKAEHAHISHSSVPETRLLKMNGTAPTSSEYTSLTLNSAASNILVNNDIMKVKQRICKECGETFVSKTELKAHRKAEHKEKKTESISVDGEVLRLLQAGDTKQNNVKESTAFASTLTVPSDADDDEPNRKRLRLDQVTVHTNEAIGSAPTSGSLPFRCEHCSKYFKLRILLNKHLTRAHPWMP